MTRNAMAFYVSMVPGLDRQPIVLPDGRMAYIRVEDSGTEDEGAALDDAEPGMGEVTLNTVAL